ncbi:MAG: GTPase ObgE [Alphaproteobacteria bacterium]
MFFLDEATIVVRGGKGGNGCVSFRHEPYVPHGGPDGGNGGNGGSVFVLADEQIMTLSDVTSAPAFVAENGQPGRNKNRYGKGGKDYVLHLPPGTVIRDNKTGLILCDLTAPGQKVVAARGGKGGRGNKSFATATDRAPRRFQKGEPGEERVLDLELKLIADVGFIGLPNAGKSTLLSRISDAHPKIAGYPFTTREPVLGIVQVDEDSRFVAADLPGLIEGAHQGTGLGDRFLRHIERTRLLCHLVDVAPLAGPEPAQAYRTVRRELELYSQTLAGKPEIVVANKLDLSNAEENLAEFQQALDAEVAAISAVTGRGLPALLRVIQRRLEQCS